MCQVWSLWLSLKGWYRLISLMLKSIYYLKSFLDCQWSFAHCSTEVPWPLDLVHFRLTEEEYLVQEVSAWNWNYCYLLSKKNIVWNTKFGKEILTMQRIRGQLISRKNGCCLISLAPVFDPRRLAGSLCSSEWINCLAVRLTCQTNA